MRLPSRVLFVGAHCDDIELFAGGLLARACFSGCARVGVIVFSDHRGVVDEATAARARAEFAANLDFVQTESGCAVIDHTALILPACRGVFEERRQDIYASLERLRDDYDLVVTHATGDTNQDHRQVSLEVQRVFKAHASVLGGEFPNNDIEIFVPRVYVELSERELDAKVRMLRAYASQQFGGRPYFDEAVTRALARVRGAQIRRPAAEAFEVAARLIVGAEGALNGVSVVLAAHDEAATIAEVVRGCREAISSLLEVIVVDDGSSDQTARLAEEAGARAVRLSKNAGKGSAIRRGVVEARGDVLVFLDADGQDDPREIPLLLAALRPGVDMVIGSRFLGWFEPGAITPLNRFGNRFLTGVLNALFGTKLTDTQAGFRAVRRSALARCRLAAARYDIEVDVVLEVLRSGGRIVEVPVRRMPRHAGTSDLHSLLDGTRILGRILRKRFERR